MYASLATRMVKQRAAALASELGGQSLKGEDAAGECKHCWYKGTIGEKCDNCGEIMEAVEPNDSFDDSFDSDSDSDSVEKLDSSVKEDDDDVTMMTTTTTTTKKNSPCRTPRTGPKSL